MGVLKALEEAGLLPDAVAGTSAGSIAAGLYASGMQIHEMEKAVHQLAVHGNDYLDPDYSGIMEFVPRLLTGRRINLQGYIKGDKLLSYFCELTGRKQLDESVVKLVIPAVDLISGQTLCFTNSETASPQGIAVEAEFEKKYENMNLSNAKYIKLDKQFMREHITEFTECGETLKNEFITMLTEYKVPDGWTILRESGPETKHDIF